MKKILLSIVMPLALTVSARATLVLSNSFEYPDGSLTAVSAGSPLGVWTAHSGAGAQAVQVSGGTITLSTGSGSAEDVNTVITNTTFPVHFTNEVLYASFTVNFSVLPTSGTTTYFAHFKDDTTSNFRCRIYSTISGAAEGKYRLGIGNGSSDAAVVIETDLDLGTTYKIVVRFSGSTNSTIWIAPSSEASAVNRADATILPSNAWKGSQSFAFRQSSGMGTMTIDDLLIGTAFSDVQTVGGAPSISGLQNVSIPANTNTGDMAFLISDVETPAASLTLSATSSNPTLIPNNPSNLTFGGSGGNRTLKVTPAPGQEGNADIEVIVTDGDSFTATNSFTITVGAPSISAIPNQITPTNTPSSAIPFTVNDAETPAASLTFSNYSSNPSLVQAANISVSVGGNNRTVTIVPEADQAGQTTIAISVFDGTQYATTTFLLTVYPHLGLVLGDTFTYPDGNLPDVSGNFWNHHSGLSNDMFVVNNQLQITGTNVDDVSAFFTNAVSFPATSGVLLYSKFTVRFTRLPQGSGGGYFAHVRDGGTSNFRGRIFASTNNAAPGKFRISISNGGFTVAQVPRDLSLDTTYIIVSRYNVGTATSTVWVNPVSEQFGGVEATDVTTPVEIFSFCLRQSASDNVGQLLLDDLLVGTAFSDVWTAPAPISLTKQVYGSDLVLSWSNPLFTLESATSVNGPYTTVPGATNPYTNSISGPEKYFRLRY